jgi:hypothetical protein
MYQVGHLPLLLHILPIIATNILPLTMQPYRPYRRLHPPPTHNVSTPSGHTTRLGSLDIRCSQVALASQFLHHFSLNNTLNHWDHGILFISNSYDHEPPDFRTTWRHLLKGRNKASFVNLQTSIIKAIAASYNTTRCNTTSAPFWWLLLHLDMLIFAPSTSQQRNNDSIQSCIRDRIEAAFAGDIEFLFESAMNVRRLTQNSKATSSSHRCAQRAADADDYRTAVARACASQTIATIGPHNIVHVKKLYTPPVPPRHHPSPAAAHQVYSLPGNICDTILTSKRNKGQRSRHQLRLDRPFYHARQESIFIHKARHPIHI